MRRSTSMVMTIALVTRVVVPENLVARRNRGYSDLRIPPRPGGRHSWPKNARRYPCLRGPGGTTRDRQHFRDPRGRAQVCRQRAGAAAPRGCHRSIAVAGRRHHRCAAPDREHLDRVWILCQQSGPPLDQRARRGGMPRDPYSTIDDDCHWRARHRCRFGVTQGSIGAIDA